MRESTIVAEWKAEARAEGIAKTRRDDLLDLLGAKYGVPISPGLVKTIEGQADIEVLSRWFKAALKADTLDSFLAELAG